MTSTKGDQNSLLTDSHRGVLDIIDSLRSKGISRYIDLPQIIVCGDQSSGKSSVLEAISGLSFPTKDALCTRFATELVLRRSCSTAAKCSIIPGSDRTEGEVQNLSSFNCTTAELDLEQVVSDAQDLMGLDRTDRVFSTDILRVEVSSPSQPHLTLVDLPGLFLAGNKDQSLEDAKLVESLVLSYMEQPRSIILAVVSAKSEFALQQVTQRAREIDPEGRRTLGLITKPDTLDEGSESQIAYLDLAQNKDVQFLHGWHVVRNRDFKARNSSTAERDAAEKLFFSRGAWASLNPTNLGIHALVTRLSKLLHDHTLEQLPRVLEEIEDHIKHCSETLSKLGDNRATARDRRRYLLRLSQAFTGLVKASVDGDYSDRSFFGDAKEAGWCSRRLRAVVQSTLASFSQEMLVRGNAIKIVDTSDDNTSDGVSDNTSPDDTTPTCVCRSKFIAEVSSMIQRNRGRELPGTFNPLIVGELFAAQCQPWKDVTEKYISQILAATQDLLQNAINHAADEVTAERLLRQFIKPATSDLERSVRQKQDELLTPHLSIHPITYNHYFIENIQKAQNERHERKLRDAFKLYINPDDKGHRQHNFKSRDLFKSVMAATEPNMDNFASTMAIDAMEAYSKVAMKRFIDDVSVLAIEKCFLGKLPSIFSPDVVCEMADNEVDELAGESQETSSLRKVTTQKVELLEEAREKLKSLNKVTARAI